MPWRDSDRPAPPRRRRYGPRPLRNRCRLWRQSAGACVIRAQWPVPTRPNLKNAAYARVCGRAFLTGASPSDFAAEDYETTWAGRATPADLNDTGRKQLGLQAR
jgi:hypothetical protein